MSETLHGHDQLPQPVVLTEMVSKQVEAHKECTKACANLSAEVNEELNQTPAGRLQLLCIEANLVLSPKQQGVLLNQPKLAKFLNKPGTLKGGRKKLCLKIIRDAVDQAFVDRRTTKDTDVNVTEIANAQTSEVSTKQLELSQLRKHRKTVETRQVEVDQGLEHVTTVIDDIFQNHVTIGTLTEIRNQVKQGLKDNPKIINADATMKMAEAKYIAPHEARLSALQSVFTPQEVQQLFGGNLVETVSLNLQGESNAVIYANVFTIIDAGITDDSRRQALRSRIEKQLGIKPHTVDVKSGGDINEVYKRGYGVETYKDENGVIQERTIPIRPNFEVEYKDGHKLGVDLRGKYASMQSPSGEWFKVRLPENPTDMEIGNKMRTAQVRVVLHSVNMAPLFYPNVTLNELGGGDMDITPDQYKITEQFLSTVVGNRALTGNDLVSSNDVNNIVYLMQFQNEKGDAVIGDVNPEQMRADYEQQGIIDKQGDIDWDRFRTMVESNRNGLFLCEQNFSKGVE